MQWVFGQGNYRENVRADFHWFSVISSQCCLRLEVDSMKPMSVGQLQMFNTITLFTPCRFFDTTPIGRILNRFSVDTRMVDQVRCLWENATAVDRKLFILSELLLQGIRFSGKQTQLSHSLTWKFEVEVRVTM